MPKREIIVPVLPKPDVPNIQGILFDGKSLKEAIDKYMEEPIHKHVVMLQTENQTGDMKADIDLDKLCGSIAEINFDEHNSQYMATIKLIPNKNSALVLNSIKNGTKFSLGTNKVGMLAEVNNSNEKDETVYPEGTRFICKNGFDIISTSLLPDWVLEHPKKSNEESPT